MKITIGIDFGTSNTVACFMKEGDSKIEIVTDSFGGEEKRVFPSVIAISPETHEKYFANEAVNMLINDCDVMPVSNFKMDLLDPKKKTQAKEYLEEFLYFVCARIKNAVSTTYPGRFPESIDINVSYPAKWSGDNELIDTVIDAIKIAFEKVGITGTINSVTEPLAAVYNMLTNNLHPLQEAQLLVPNQFRNVLLLDMGAGTADICIFRLTIDESGNPVMKDLTPYPSRSESRLCGGREIDELLYKYLIEYCRKKGLSDIDPDTMNIMAVKFWKEGISDLLGKNEKIYFPSQLSQIAKRSGRNDIIDSFKNDFTRAEFERVTKSYWEKLYGFIRSAMTQCNFVRPEDIDIVALTGGNSVWYCISKLYSGEGICDVAKDGSDTEVLNFAKIKADPWKFEAFRDAYPQESVAKGLCLKNQMFDGELKQPNNIWVQITTNDIESDIEQVVYKNDVLPVERAYSHQVIFSQNSVLGNLKFDVTVDLYIGESIDNSEHRTLELSKDKGGFWSRFLNFMLILPLLISGTYPVKTSLKVKMTETGILELAGEFSVDDYISEFSHNDFRIVKNED